MKTIHFGNIYYYLYIIITMMITIGCILFLKNKSMDFKNNFIFTLLISAFILHFLKLFFPPYLSGLPKTFRKSSFENICAVSTLLFPWFYLSKKKWMMNYMVVMGIISGLIAILIPLEAFNKSAFTFDTFRFYYAHIIIYLAPFLMVYTGVYKFNYHSILKVPFAFYGVLLIILINEFLVMWIGWVPDTITQLFDPTNGRNPSFIFGIPEQYEGAKDLITVFVPRMFQTVPNWMSAQQLAYFPILWMVIPAYIYIVIFGYIIGLLFDRDHVVEDFKKLFRRNIEPGDLVNVND